MNETARRINEKMRDYNYIATHFSEESDKTTIKWSDYWVRCQVTVTSIDVYVSFPEQYLETFPCDENGISQAVSQIINAFEMENDYTLECYGDEYGVPRR